nr:sigma-70 family RNA polymerase sigma factor [Paenibacillus koleovorans]
MSSFEYLSALCETTDKDAILQDLIRHFGRDVWNYAYFLTGRMEVADDVFQDVFVKVYRNLYNYRGDSTVKTWLLAITRNVVKDHWKSAWTRRVLLMGALTRRHETVSSTEKEVLSRMESGDIWKAVLELPDKLKEVMVLYAHHQLTVPEIADLLRLREGTVKSRLHRARGKIQFKLDQAEQALETRGRSR